MRAYVCVCVREREKESRSECLSLSLSLCPRACEFVCAMSYYRRFLPNFAELARPLLEVTTQHHKQFKWTQEHDLAFYKLIDLLVTHTSLNIPDENNIFVNYGEISVCVESIHYEQDYDIRKIILNVSFVTLLFSFFLS